MSTENNQPLEQPTEPAKPLTAQPTEIKLEPTTLPAVTKQDRMVIRTILNEHMNTMNQDPKSKALIIKSIQKDMPNIKESTIKSLYRQAEADYYLNLKRIPAEALLNKFNEKYEYLEERILNESSRDITFQADSIANLLNAQAKLNKLIDVAPVVSLNFVQELSESSLLNPQKAEIIDAKE